MKKITQVLDDSKPTNVNDDVMAILKMKNISSLTEDELNILALENEAEQAKFIFDKWGTFTNSDGFTELNEIDTHKMLSLELIETEKIFPFSAIYISYEVNGEAFLRPLNFDETKSVLDNTLSVITANQYCLSNSNNYTILAVIPKLGVFPLVIRSGGIFYFTDLFKSYISPQSNISEAQFTNYIIKNGK